MFQQARFAGLLLTVCIWLTSHAGTVPLEIGMDPEFIAQQEVNGRAAQKSAPATKSANDADVYHSGDTVSVLCFEDVYTFGTSGGTDCWGYEAPDGTEYAIMGVSAGVVFVDVTHGDVIDTVPQSSCGASWRDVKTWGNYCYGVSECTGTNAGILVIDMSHLPDSVHLVRVTAPNPSSGNLTSHNLAIDSIAGYLYTEGSTSSFDQIRVHDLNDPGNPQFVTSFGTGFSGSIHDMYVYNDTMYLAEGGNPYWSIWDMSDKMNPQLLIRVTIPSSGYVHNIWPTDDRRHVVTTEETAGKTVKIWNIENFGDIQLVGNYLGSSGLAHNAHLIGDTLYLSHYESGVRVVDISNPSAPSQIGAYDTYTTGEAGNFNGCWGAFPYTNSGRVYGSNLDGRLFVLNHFKTVLVDSLLASETVALPGQQVKIDITAVNSLDVRQFIIPVNYGGPYNLTFDSASVVGLRTEYFDNIGLAGSDPFNSRFSYLLSAGTQAPLSPGSGPILSLYFSVPLGASGVSNPITFTPFNQFSASFSNLCMGGYTPDTVSGAVLLGASCCQGIRGNINADAVDLIDITDLTYLVAFSFKSGPPPPCLPEGNVNGDQAELIDISDLTMLVKYMFNSGASPAVCD